MKNETKRWIILLSLIINLLCTGSVYIWSIFNKPLMELMDWSIGKVSLAYSLLMLVILVFNLLSAPLQKRIGHRGTMLLAVVFWSAGWFLTGYATSTIQLYIFFSGLVGIGGGFAYNTLVAVIPRWFPDKLGIANGLAIGASGLAPLVFTPIATHLLSSVGVQGAFRFMGILFLITMGATAWMVTVPEMDWKPDGWEPAGANGSANGGLGCTTREMVKQPLFYMLWFVLLASVTSGMMMTGHAAGIGESIGMTAEQGAMLVGLLAIVNFLGRLIFGFLSDRIGRYRVITLTLGITAVGMLALGFVTQTSQFLLVFSLIGLSFGAIMAVYPAISAEQFGHEHMASNWAVLYSGYSAASFVGPATAAACLESTGNYNIAFLIAGGLGILAFIVFALARKVASGGLTTKNAVADQNGR